MGSVYILGTGTDILLIHARLSVCHILFSTYTHTDEHCIGSATLLGHKHTACTSTFVKPHIDIMQTALYSCEDQQETSSLTLFFCPLQVACTRTCIHSMMCHTVYVWNWPLVYAHHSSSTRMQWNTNMEVWNMKQSDNKENIWLPSPKFTGLYILWY